MSMLLNNRAQIDFFDSLSVKEISQTKLVSIVLDLLIKVLQVNDALVFILMEQSEVVCIVGVPDLEIKLSDVKRFKLGHGLKIVCACDYGFENCIYELLSFCGKSSVCTCGITEGDFRVLETS